MQFKNSTLFLSIFLLFSTLTVFSQRFSGKVNNLSDGSFIRVYEYYGNVVKPFDSIKVKNEEFAFKRNFPRGFYRVSAGANQNATLILGNESVKINANGTDFANSLKADGSKENKLYKEYLVSNQNYTDQINPILQEAQRLQSTPGIEQNEIMNQMNLLKYRFDSVNAARSASQMLIAKENKGLFISKVIASMIFDANTTRESYFQQSDFEDAEMTRGDMFNNKVNIFLQSFPSDNPMEEGKFILNQAPKASASREIVYMALVEYFIVKDSKTAQSFAKEFKSEYPKSPYPDQFLTKFPKSPPTVGDLAPEISLLNSDGKQMSLSELKGKVVLLDFWASWCGPCRRENPNVVKVYDKYQKEGFTVFSVSLDDNRDKWLNAIQADNLKWPYHVSELKGWQSTAAAQYSVRGIPATFLIDKEGIIIAKDLRGNLLEATLEDLFTKQ